MNRQASALAGLALADVAALVCLRPHLRALSAQLAAPHAWVVRSGVDAVLAAGAGAALWCVAAWLGAGLLAAALGRLPGALGQAGRRAADRLLPGALRRLVAGSAGVGMLLAPVTAAAAHPAPAAPSVAAAVATLPTPGWPVDPPPAALPTPGWPVDPPPAALPAPGWPARTPPDASGGGPVRVQPGDSLWLIAARRLGPQPAPAAVAAQWHRWYAANRRLIGADPSLIRPGQLLRPPDAGAHR
jgi:nucleoid-associated protein YgaU